MKKNNDVAALFTIITLLIIIAGLASLSGCVKEKPTVMETITVAEPVAESAGYTALWGPSHDDWTEFLVSSLEIHGERMLSMSAPTDAKNWCPKFSELTRNDRIQVFVTMISAMAYKESAWKPDATYLESFKDSKGQRVLSQGLLQISQESANQKAYGCSIKNPSELKDPKTNLECGVKILNHWLPKDKAFGYGRATSDARGAARYWSVMRDSSGAQDYIKGKVKSLEICN